MEVIRNKLDNQIIVKCAPFNIGVNSERNIINHLEKYFIDKGFKILNSSDKVLTVSIGNLFTNFITLSMKKLKREISVIITENDQIEILSKVDTTGQVIRKSEMDYFTLEVEDIKSYIQGSKDYDLADKKNKKIKSINLWLLILLIFGIPIVYLLIYFLYNYLTN